MDNEHIILVLNDINKIQDAIQNAWNELLLFVDKFSYAVSQEKLKLPYHLNVIDELHINENGHSRILYKLLLYVNVNGEYEILESLINYIQQHTHSSEFDRIQIKKPYITQETKRIDLWVRDSNYALIFENKIYNAVDQEAQLSRYIDCTKECKYEEKDIFVIYLPPSSGKEPDPKSWGKYKKRFEDRYINLSFEKDILPWLEDEVLPNINNKDIYLRSAIRQYTDYLHGLFMTRTIYKQMNMNLRDILMKHYKLDECKTDRERIEVIDEKLEEINEIWTQLDSLKNQLRDKITQSYITKWEKTVQKKYGEYFDAFKELEFDIYIGVVFKIRNKKVLVYINKDKGKNQLFCQAEYLYKDIGISDTFLEKSVKELLPSANQSCRWKYFPIEDYDEVFACFQKVVDKCLNQ